VDANVQGKVMWLCLSGVGFEKLAKNIEIALDQLFDCLLQIRLHLSSVFQFKEQLQHDDFGSEGGDLDSYRLLSQPSP
jgi:hypothetical protein